LAVLAGQLQACFDLPGFSRGLPHYFGALGITLFAGMISFL